MAKYGYNGQSGDPGSPVLALLRTLYSGWPEPEVARRANHAEKLREELTLARIDRHSGQLEELDVEGILAFAERVRPRAGNLWVQASLEQRQRFQQLFFPDGVGRKSVCWNARTGLQLLAGNQN